MSSILHCYILRLRGGVLMDYVKVVEKLSPLSEQSLYILLSLYKGENHGYGIVIKTRDMTEGDIELNPTTVYKAINRFVEYGLVTFSDEYEDKKCYKITESGVAFLKHEHDRLKLLNSNILKSIRGD